MSEWPARLAGGTGGGGRSCLAAGGVTGIPLQAAHQLHPPLLSSLPSALPGCFPTPVASSVVARLHSAEPGCYLKHGSTVVYRPSRSTLSLGLFQAFGF